MPSSMTLLTSRSVTRETTAASVVFNISLAADIAGLQYIFRQIGIYTPDRPNSIGPPDAEAPTCRWGYEPSFCARAVRARNEHARRANPLTLAIAGDHSGPPKSLFSHDSSGVRDVGVAGS